MSDISPSSESSVSLFFSRMRGRHGSNASVRSFFLGSILVFMWMFFSASAVSNLSLSSKGSAKDEVKEDFIPPDFVEELGRLVASSPAEVTAAGTHFLQQYKYNPDYSKELARVFYLMGVAYYFQGFYQLSNSNYMLAFPYYEQQNDLNMIDALHTNMGVNYELMGKYDLALASYQQSKEISIELDDQRAMNLTKLNMGLLAKKVGQYNLAIRLTEGSLQFFESAQEEYYIGLASMNMGVIIDKRGNYDQSLSYFQRAEVIFDQLGETATLLRTRLNLAVRAFHLNQHEEALVLLYSILDQYHEGMDPLLRRYSHVNIAMNLHRLERFEEALEALNHAETSEGPGSLSPEFQLRVNEISRDVYLSLGEVESWTILANEFEELVKKNKDEAVRIAMAEKEMMMAYDDIVAELYSEQRMKGLYKVFMWVMVISVVLVVVLVFHRTIILGANRFIPWFPWYKTTDASSDQNSNSTPLLSLSRPIESNLDTSAESNLYDEDDDEDRSLLNLYNSICQIVADERLYLNPDLKIGDISTKLYSNDKYVSEAINRNAGCNFNRFINEYRVAMAKELLKNYEEKGIRLGDIAFLSGFKNDSTFYRNFREITGTTPSLYYNTKRKKAISLA